MEAIRDKETTERHERMRCRTERSHSKCTLPQAIASDGAKRVKRQEKDFSRHTIRQCLVDEINVLEWDILLDKKRMEASKSYSRQLELWERKNAVKRVRKREGDWEKQLLW